MESTNDNEVSSVGIQYGVRHRDPKLSNISTSGGQNEFQHTGIKDSHNERNLTQPIPKTNFRHDDLEHTANAEAKAKANQVPQDRKTLYKNGILPEKQFLPRNSLLTDMFETKNIRTLYHIFIVIFLILFLNTIVHDYVADGSINLGQNVIIFGFGKFGTVILIWLCMQVSTFGVYICFGIWCRVRTYYKPKTTVLRCWDYFWLVAFITYQCIFFYIPVKMMMLVSFPPASSLTVIMEQTRFVMKTHAFVRSNVPKMLAYSRSTEGTSYPPFSNYVYYLFAPTLVYRDSYPRTKEIRWIRVAYCYTEVICVIFSISFIFERFMMPFYKQFGKIPLEPKNLVQCLFGSMMPCMYVYLSAFYCLLHAWMNASAEMLRFADRQFYQDWWNSSSFGMFYRTWNIIVHDWLYLYIYKDFYEIIIPKNKMASTLMVFFTSALFHEYILSFAFGFFYPVMLVFFGGFGLLLVFITKQKHNNGGNVFLWLAISTGFGLMFSMYCMEYYARINCPAETDSLWEYFVPKSWSCNGLVRTRM